MLTNPFMILSVSIGHPSFLLTICCVYIALSKTRNDGLLDPIPRLTSLLGRLLLEVDFNAICLDSCSSETSYDALVVKPLKPYLGQTT